MHNTRLLSNNRMFLLNVSFSLFTGMTLGYLFQTWYVAVSVVNAALRS